MIELLLKPVDVNKLLLIICIVLVLALLLSVLIVLISKLCFVKENEKVKQISQFLGGANCGGCGFAGCNEFAKALADGKADLNACSSISNQNKESIAKILDVPFSASTPKIAVVKCAGGINAKDKFSYVGNQSCLAKIEIFSGNKICKDACLGGATCAEACIHNGIKIENGVAIISHSICRSCGACIAKCPKNLIEFMPKTAKVYVACSSHCSAKDVLSACSVGCIGCGVCVKNCPQNAISMVNNLATIDYDKCNGCLTCVSKCPRHTIKIK